MRLNDNVTRSLILAIKVKFQQIVCIKKGLVGDTVMLTRRRTNENVKGLVKLVLEQDYLTSDMLTVKG